MKKHISLAVVFMMLFTFIFSNVTFAAYTDVTSENKYYDAITTLSKLNVINGYEDGTFKPEATITRAEFTKIVVYTLGLQDLQTAPTEFSDITDHWAKYNIKAAYDMGIINGMGDGTFAPDANVTYEQALKMVVCMLGYKQYAENAGGYPEGYRTEATSLKLTSDISGASYEAAATRGVIAQLIYNALEVNMLTTDSLGNTIDDDDTLLNDYLNVKRLKGILVGVEDYKTGDCTENLNLKELDVLGSKNEGEVVIDFTGYTENITDLTKYLGKTITLYYRQKNLNDTPTLVIIDDESTNNVEYSITFDNIDRFNGKELTYYVDGDSTKTKKLKFSDDDINIRYNGRVVKSGDSFEIKKQYLDGDLISTRSKYVTFDEALSEWLDPSSDYFIYGEVVLTDRGSDGLINDVQINDYNTIVAYRTPTTSDYRITDKLVTGNYITLNPDATQYSYTLTKNGSQIAVTSLSAGDIVLYAESLDGDLYTCVADTKTVSGKITSINRDDNEIYIDNVIYNLGDMCEQYIKTNQDGKTIATGQSGKFYVDKYNTIVYATIEDEATKPYAYISNAYTSDDGSDQYIMAFIPSKSTSGTASYQLKDKVTINGKRVDSTEAIDILTELSKNAIAEDKYYSNNDLNNETLKKDIYGSNTTKFVNACQPVRIEIDSDNKVTSIVTVSTDSSSYNDDGTTAISTNEDTTKIVRCKDLTQYSYTSSSFTLSNKSQFSVNSSTTIIYVPGDRSDKNSYTKKSVSSFTSTEKYYVEAYDINSSKVAGLVILYGKSGSTTAVTKTTDYSIVAEIPQTVYDDDKGEDKTSISVYAGTSSTAKKWTTADDKEFKDVVVGDVIQFGYDQDGYAQDRVDIIKFADIAEIIDGKTTTVTNEDGESHEEMYNWAQESTDEDSVQTQTFNYRFPKSNTNSNPWYETYVSSTLGTIPYSRACMYNVYQIQEDSNKLLLTQGGFEVNGSDVSNTLYDTDDYEELTISSSTKILRMESDRKKLSPYVEDTETAMTYRDLKAAQNYGSECSKILVCTLRGTARLIIVYN